MMLLSLGLNCKRHKDLVCIYSEIMLVTLIIRWLFW